MVEGDNNSVMRRRKKLLGEVGGEATTRILVRERDGTDRAREKGERERGREWGDYSCEEGGGSRWYADGCLAQMMMMVLQE